MAALIWLAAYRAAWRLALPPIRLAILLDAALRALGLALLPRAWRARERLGDTAAPVPGRPVWMHCASLGEAKGLWALAESLPPDLPLLLTATTPEGIAFLEARCAGSPRGPLRRAFPAPFDHPAVARAFLQRHALRGLVLYEVELWPNWLGECRRLGLPAALAAGRLTPDALRAYRRFGGAPARLLSSLAWIQAQSPADADRFTSLAAAPVTTGFDFKAAHFLARPAGHPRPAPQRTRYAFVSLHLAELRLLLPAIKVLAARGEVVIFPRRPGEFPGFRERLQPMGFSLRSREPEARLLLVDGFGHVQSLLPSCHTAFVGGSLVPAGCHNLWEPLAAGARIRFGPHYRAQEALATLLLENGLARSVGDPSLLAEEPAPGPEVPAACAAFAESLRERLETALEASGKAIIATFIRRDKGQGPGPRETAPERASEGTAR